MDTALFYRLIDAVRDSLDRAGRHGYTLQRADRHEGWLDLRWLQDYLEESGHESIPLMWEGRALASHDSVKVACAANSRKLWRHDRTGEILLRDDALVAAVTALADDGIKDTILIVGERAPGALQRFVDAYGVFARRKSREWPWIYAVGGDPLPRPRSLDWNSLIVPPEFKDELRRQVSTFFEFRSEYARLGIPHRRGLLFTGPPGNGKTSALRLIASDRNEPFFTCTITDLTDRSDIDEAFDMAELDAPSILCFEDLDSLFKDSLGLSHFLNRLDGIHPLEGVLVLSTTNHPEELDAALTERPSRFDRIFHFGNPGPDERRRYLREGFGSVFDERLVVDTEGFSMAQVKEVRVSACLESIHHGLPEPTLAAAAKSIERMRSQRTVVQQEWEPGRTIAGFQGTKPADERTPTGNLDRNGKLDKVDG
jgi:hypothetical protein